MLAVAEAARNVACVGAEPIGGTNNLNFGNPERPEIMWQLGEAVRGIGDACRALEIPITGGNVSLYNETDRRAIFPTPVLGVVGLMDDASKIVTRVFKRAGAVVVMLGDNHGELGGSEYLAVMHGRVCGRPPVLDLGRERALQQVIIEAIRGGLVESAHDCSEGGLAVTLAECCFGAGGIGVVADVPASGGEFGPYAVNATLFGESASRIVVSTSTERLPALLAAAAVKGVAARQIGATGGDRLQITVAGQPSLDCEVRTAEQVWMTAIEARMDPHAQTHGS
jgi:phosphoribosylformylglycinamidine synthase